ncbi:MAG: phosphoribosyltransferase family protein [Campylobacterota bacterium]|nr:phosphoribosyltransferase family protein [Campylobacterota bacterium]
MEKDFFVYSFYSYEDVKILINSKYEFYGDKVFDILAKLSFKVFAQDFNFRQVLHVIPIDDHTRHDFSQTALLGKYLKSDKLQPVYGTLYASNIVKYAGKDLNFRQNNKRNFKYTGRSGLAVVLVDDMVTTGTTILEAKKVLEEHNCTVIFALTLCDAKI